jgi:hypothetical protein
MLKIFFASPQKKDFIGNAIKFFGFLKSGDCNVCHCGFIINGRTYEALMFGGVASRNFEMAYKNKKTEVYSIKSEYVSLQEISLIKKDLEEMIGKPFSMYGLLKIPLQATDSMLSFILRRKIFFATKLFSTKWFPICSALVSYELYKHGKHGMQMLFKDWRGFSPDDVKDILDKYSYVTIKEKLS